LSDILSKYSNAKLKNKKYNLTTDIAIIPNYLEYTHWQGLTPKRRQGHKPRIGWAGAGNI
jgi:hypothetical protein